MILVSIARSLASLEACHISRDTLRTVMDTFNRGGDEIRSVPRTAPQPFPSKVFLVVCALFSPLPTWCSKKICHLSHKERVSLMLTCMYYIADRSILRHKIERPKQDVDFVYVPGKNQPRKELFPVTLVPSTNLRCLKCPEPKNLRLWSLRSLMAHLSDKWVLHMLQ